MSQLFTPPHLKDSRWQNMRVGLLGGSFNPPHEGHVHISLVALQMLQLDAIWWLVTPQNPLKMESPLPLEERVKLCRALVQHPKVHITDMEKDLGTVNSYDTVCALKKHFPGTQFAWITGMDNALTLHTWHRWQDLLAEICTVHLTRMPAMSLIRNCPLRLYAKQRHIFLDKAGRHSLDSGRTYWLLQKKMVDVSSTQLRNNNQLESMA